MSAVLGTFADFKTVKTRGVCQLIIEVPIESADHALAVLGGVPQAKAEQWVGIAPVGAPETSTAARPAPPAPPTPEAIETPEEDTKATTMWSEAKRRMVQRAALVCKEETFQQHIANGFRVMWNHPQHANLSAEDKAAYHVRNCCGVTSRADIGPAEESGARFRDLMARYEHSQRGRGDADMARQAAEGPG